MYTGSVVIVRCSALMLALLFAATPMLGIVCEMDCDRPAAPSSACHEAAAPQDGASLRGAPHACDSDHAGSRPARLTSTNGRDSVGPAFDAGRPAVAHGYFRETWTAPAALMHDPPGLTARSTSSHLIVLRI